MFIPDAYYQIAKIQHQEMLKEIEAYQLYRQLRGNQPSFWQQIRHQVKAAEQWVKFHTHSNMAEPCFDGS